MHHDQVDFEHVLKILNNQLLLKEDYLLELKDYDKSLMNEKRILPSAFPSSGKILLE
jgi:hypothetical protein